MRIVLLIASVTLLAGCQYTVFAEPEVVYSTRETIGVRYVSSGVIGAGNEQQAMALIANHCGSSYRVTSRTSHRKQITVDATCGR